MLGVYADYDAITTTVNARGHGANCKLADRYLNGQRFRPDARDKLE